MLPLATAKRGWREGQRAAGRGCSRPQLQGRHAHHEQYKPFFDQCAPTGNRKKTLEGGAARCPWQGLFAVPACRHQRLFSIICQREPVAVAVVCALSPELEPCLVFLWISTITVDKRIEIGSSAPISIVTVNDWLSIGITRFGSGSQVWSMQRMSAMIGVS